MALKLPTSCHYRLVVIGIVAFGPGPATATSPAVEAAISTLEKIPADPMKFEAFCNLLGQMRIMLYIDAAKYEVLERQLDAVIGSYGTELAAAWDTVSGVDTESEDGGAVAATFDALEGKCP